MHISFQILSRAAAPIFVSEQDVQIGYRDDKKPRPHSAFTLIELLIVIAVIAVLSVVVVLALNPAELLRQSRDANRLSDMASLSSAVSLYLEDSGGTGAIGLSSTSYMSVMDASATTTARRPVPGPGPPCLGYKLRPELAMRGFKLLPDDERFRLAPCHPERHLRRFPPGSAPYGPHEPDEFQPLLYLWGPGLKLRLLCGIGEPEVPCPVRSKPNEHRLSRGPYPGQCPECQCPLQSLRACGVLAHGRGAGQHDGGPEREREWRELAGHRNRHIRLLLPEQGGEMGRDVRWGKHVCKYRHKHLPRSN